MRNFSSAERRGRPFTRLPLLLLLIAPIVRASRSHRDNVPWETPTSCDSALALIDSGPDMRATLAHAADLARAIVDRLMERGEVIRLKGKSYRAHGATSRFNPEIAPPWGRPPKAGWAKPTEELRSSVGLVLRVHATNTTRTCPRSSSCSAVAHKEMRLLATLSELRLRVWAWLPDAPGPRTPQRSCSSGAIGSPVGLPNKPMPSDRISASR